MLCEKNSSFAPRLPAEPRVGVIFVLHSLERNSTALLVSENLPPTHRVWGIKPGVNTSWNVYGKHRETPDTPERGGEWGEKIAVKNHPMY